MLFDPAEKLKLLKHFNVCAPIFIALGDACRQQLIIDIADAGSDGLNVTNLSALSHLSRPAISHHLKVLKDAGLIVPFKQGTQIFYRLSMKENIHEVEQLLESIKNFIALLESKEVTE